MSFSISVTVDTRELERITGNLDGATDAVVRELAFEVDGWAKTFAPVDTGALRDSIDTQPMNNAWYRIAPHVDYAIYQEFGTYKMAAHPFLTPAAERVMSKFMSPATWMPLFK